MTIKKSAIKKAGKPAAKKAVVSKNATTAPVSDSAAVSAHIKKLDKSIIPAVEEIRKIILAVDKTIGEEIKWNNPCFIYTGEMEPFNPKEYKRYIVVMNLFKNRLMLVLPKGARLKDPSGLLQGDYKDGRRFIVFKDLAGIKSRKKELQALIRSWLDTKDA